MASGTFVLYRIAVSRGSDVLKTVLGDTSVTPAGKKRAEPSIKGQEDHQKRTFIAPSIE
jgi:hypothetical protein